MFLTTHVLQKLKNKFILNSSTNLSYIFEVSYSKPDCNFLTFESCLVLIIIIVWKNYIFKCLLVFSYRKLKILVSAAKSCMSFQMQCCNVTDRFYYQTV